MCKRSVSVWCAIGLFAWLGGVGVSTSAAANYYWATTTSGNWNNGNNWSPSGIPGALDNTLPSPPAADHAILSATGGAYIVNANTSRRLLSLQLLSPDATLTYGSGVGLRTQRLDLVAGNVGNGGLTIESGGTLGFGSTASPPLNLTSQQTIGSNGILNIGNALTATGQTAPYPYNLRLFMGGGLDAPTTLNLPKQALPGSIAGGGYEIRGTIIFSPSSIPGAEINVDGGTVLLDNNGYINFDGPSNGTFPAAVRGSLMVRSSIYARGSVNVRDSLTIEGGTVQVVGSAPVLTAASIVSRAVALTPTFSLPARITGNLAVDPSGDYMEVSGGKTEFGGRLMGNLYLGSDGILAPRPTATGTGLVIDNTLTLFGGSQIEFKLRGVNQSTTLNTDVTSGSATLRIARDASFTPLPGMRFGSVWTAITDDLFPSAVQGIVNVTGLAGLRFQAVNTPGSERSLDLLVTGRPGDANLDDQVNFADLLTLAQNYGQPSPKNWLQGDFNGDAIVNFTDLLALAQNYGVPAVIGDGAAFGNDAFAADWALALHLAQTPEPATAVSLVAGGWLLRRRRGV